MYSRDVVNYVKAFNKKKLYIFIILKLSIISLIVDGLIELTHI